LFLNTLNYYNENNALCLFSVFYLMDFHTQYSSTDGVKIWHCLRLCNTYFLLQWRNDKYSINTHLKFKTWDALSRSEDPKLNICNSPWQFSVLIPNSFSILLSHARNIVSLQSSSISLQNSKAISHSIW